MKNSNIIGLKTNGFCFLEIFNKFEISNIYTSSKTIIQYFEQKKNLNDLNLKIIDERENYQNIDNSNHSILVDRRQSYYDNGI